MLARLDRLEPGKSPWRCVMRVRLEGKIALLKERGYADVLAEEDFTPIPGRPAEQICIYTALGIDWKPVYTPKRSEMNR